MGTKTFNSNLFKKKVNYILCLVLASLAFAGCSQEGTVEERETTEVEQSKATIKTVLEKEFTGPNEEVIKLKEEIDEKLSEKMEDAAEEGIVSLSEDDPEQQSYLSYLENTYASYFTEKAFDEFSKTVAFSHHQPGDSYKINISDVEIFQSENTPTNFKFTVHVNYENPFQESAKYEIGGSTIITEDGKIGKIDFDDKDGLFQKINVDIH